MRSPAEYAEDCIPGAINMPALSNEERAAVGILHKTAPFAARRRGAGMVAANIAAHLQTHLAERPPSWRPLVYCWRGGQRSGAVVEVLRRIGWDAQQLAGGYKTYRQAVINGIATLSPSCRWLVIGGKTGAGKTQMLGELRARGRATMDLEALSGHRGSAFGDTGEQPTQRKFESRIFATLTAAPQDAPVFVEAESRKIGRLHLPQPLLSAMRRAPVFFLEVSLAERARHIVQCYAAMRDPDKFAAALERIGKYAGSRRQQAWHRRHTAGQWQELAEDLLASFYDLGYQKSMSTNYAPAVAVFAFNPNCADSVRHTADSICQTAARSGKM